MFNIRYPLLQDPPFPALAIHTRPFGAALLRHTPLHERPTRWCEPPSRPDRGLRIGGRQGSWPRASMVSTKPRTEAPPSHRWTMEPHVRQCGALDLGNLNLFPTEVEGELYQFGTPGFPGPNVQVNPSCSSLSRLVFGGEVDGLQVGQVNGHSFVHSGTWFLAMSWSTDAFLCSRISGIFWNLAERNPREGTWSPNVSHLFI